MAKRKQKQKQKLSDLVPTNWLDPLLTGPQAALSDAAGKWGCPDIERLLLAIKKRIAGVERTARGKER